MVATSLVWTFASVSVATPLVIGAQQAELTAPTQELGWSLALDGTTLLTGAPWDSSDTGAAFLFTRSGATWTLGAKLVGSDSVANDELGMSVALSGDVAIVGSPNASSQAGAAYFFQQTGGVWSEVNALKGSTTSDNLGFAVAVEGDTAMVGAPGAVAGGSVFVYARSGTTWSQTQRLSAPSGAAAMGVSIALQGDTAIVGAPATDTLKGAVYVYVRSGATWALSATLKVAATMHFGEALALDVDTAVIGSPLDANSKGAAYVFVRAGTTWTQQAALLAPDGLAGDEAGAAVAIRGDDVVIGAPLRGSLTGNAYSFRRAGTSWQLSSRLAALDAANNSSFGGSIAILSDATTLIGASGAGSGDGAVYVFVPAPGYGAPCAAASGCASNSCVDGVCCSTGACDTCATCNGTTPGTCATKLLGAVPTTTCGEYACNGNGVTCPTGCAGDKECVAGAKCSLATKTCLQGASCAVDRSSSTDPSGVVTQCTTYLCDPKSGLCGGACALVNDCAGGYTCDSTSKCVPTVVPNVDAAPGGCAVRRRLDGDAGTGAVAVLAIAGLTSRRRRT
ncbi:MAG: hypothetical protein ACHREM_21905 [Polyangiales bacterium]